MIRHCITRMFIFSAFCLAPSNHAAEHNDQLDAMLKEKFIAYEDKETSLQKSWRLAKEYGPFATSVALGSYFAYKSMPHHGHLDRVPGFIFSGINAYALYKSHTMTKEWLKQLPTERTYPFQLSLLCVTGFATSFCSIYFFEPNYIATLSSLILLTTSTFNFIDAHDTQHRQDKSIIHDTTMNITKLMLNDHIYGDLRQESNKKRLEKNPERYYGRLYSLREDNEKIAHDLKRNVGTIMQLPWGSQFFAALSPNARHAIFKSVGWQIEHLKGELDMDITKYPQEFAVPKLKSDIYTPIKKS